MGEHFLQWINLVDFKCFHNFEAKDFKRINLISGKNNVGKTAFMEACFLNTFHSPSLAFAEIIFSRYEQHFFSKLVSDTKVDYIFKFIEDESHKYNTTLFKSNLKETNISYVKDELLKQKNNKAIYVFFNSSKSTYSMFENLYANIQESKKEYIIDDLINQFDDSLDSFRIIKSEPKCSLKSDGKFYNINEFGEGLGKYLTFILALVSSNNSYLFIDEIENGIHYTHLDKLWEIILKVSKEQNVQVFATTHSKECIESYARVAKKLEDEEITFIELGKNKNNEIKAITMDYDRLQNEIENANEVRGW